MSILKKIAAAGLGLASMVTAAHADDKFAYTWTVTGASDYIFRGLSYTQNDPTVNSYLELTYNTGSLLGTAYLGLWTSNIDTGDTGLGPWEQDIYLGVRPVTGPVSWDIGALWYIYGNKGDDSKDTIPGKNSTWDTDYVEFKVAGTWATPIKNLALGGTFYWTPDQDLASPENISIEGNAAYTLPAIGIFTPTISGLIGHTDADDNSFWSKDSAQTLGYWQGAQEYTYWNAGVKLAVEKFTFDFRYWDTDVKDTAVGAKFADERFVFTGSITLP